jgi:hypothetical protein
MPSPQIAQTPPTESDAVVHRATLEQLLIEAESLVRRLEENIAFQRTMIAKLEGGGHDVKAARMFLRRLEAKHAKHVADRDRLFKEVANRS